MCTVKHPEVPCFIIVAYRKKLEKVGESNILWIDKIKQLSYHVSIIIVQITQIWAREKSMDSQERSNHDA